MFSWDSWRTPSGGAGRPAPPRVLDLLAQGELSVGELVERLGLTQPQTSKHLRVLRDAGLVRVEQQAQRRIYAVEPSPMAELDEWLAPYRRLWNASLDRLGRPPGSTRRQ